MNVRFAAALLAGATSMLLAAPTATAAFLFHFSKTRAQPGQVVHVTTDGPVLPRTNPMNGARWHLFLVRVEIARGAPRRGMDGVVPVAPLRFTRHGSVLTTFRVPSVRAGYYTPAIGCRACSDRPLILAGEHRVAPRRKDILRITRRR